jgi:hypothetical protein
MLNLPNSFQMFKALVFFKDLPSAIVLQSRIY